MTAQGHFAVRGYARPDGTFGLRNHVLAISLIDLANDVAARITCEVAGVVAVLTPAGGLSFGEEARLLDRLRWRLCRNPNVGGIIIIGTTLPARGTLIEMAGPGRFVEAVSLLDMRDMRAAVDRGMRAAKEIIAALAGQRRVEHDLGALRVGIRSSSSSLESARLVNPVVGAAVDGVVGHGGAVCFGELADIAGVVEQLVGRAASAEIGGDIRRTMDQPCRVLAGLGADAPDPTPTNMHGGIGTLAAKGEGALRRLGAGPIAGVFGFGEELPGAGLQMMDGPGSAAICLAGLAAAGCTLILYTVGATSSTAAMPVVPVIRVGPPTLKASCDIDLCVLDDETSARAQLLDIICDIASGQLTAGESDETRQIMLPGYLPPL